MKILAVDTSEKLASVCYKYDNKKMYKEDTNNVTHSERLLKLIDDVLSNEKCKISDLDYLMTTNGPGSFTGARIGSVTIKGLAIPYDKKIIAVTSTEILALDAYLRLNSNDEKIICSMLDAKNNRAYYGIYKFKKIKNKIDIEVLNEASNDDLNEIYAKILEFKNITIISDFSEKIKEVYDNKKIQIIDENSCPNANQLISYYENVSEDIIKEHITDAYELDIIYARKPQAERMLNGEKN